MKIFNVRQNFVATNFPNLNIDCCSVIRYSTSNIVLNQKHIVTFILSFPNKHMSKMSQGWPILNLNVIWVSQPNKNMRNFLKDNIFSTWTQHDILYTQQCLNWFLACLLQLLILMSAFCEKAMTLAHWERLLRLFFLSKEEKYVHLLFWEIIFSTFIINKTVTLLRCRNYWDIIEELYHSQSNWFQFQIWKKEVDIKLNDFWMLRTC